MQKRATPMDNFGIEMEIAIELARSTGHADDELRKFRGIETLFFLSQQPDLREQMAYNGAMNVLLDAVADKDMWGKHGQLLAIGALGMIAYVADPHQKARKILFVNAGGIDVLVSVAQHRDMHGTIFQHKSLEALWAVCCAKQVCAPVHSCHGKYAITWCGCNHVSVHLFTPSCRATFDTFPVDHNVCTDRLSGTGAPDFYERRTARHFRP
jgi:hypothetical protein